MGSVFLACLSLILYRFAPARFNHRFDEVRACRQEIVQILDQKLAKQGLSPVSITYFKTFVSFSPQEKYCMR